MIFFLVFLFKVIQGLNLIIIYLIEYGIVRGGISILFFDFEQKKFFYVYGVDMRVFLVWFLLKYLLSMLCGSVTLLFYESECYFVVYFFGFWYEQIEQVL